MDEVTTVETVGTDPMLAELQAMRQDIIACRDVSTILLAVVLAFCSATVILRWTHGR